MKNHQLLDDLIASNGRYIKLWRTSALFKASLTAYLDHVLPTYLEGLAVQAERQSESFDQQIHQAVMYGLPGTPR